MKFPCSLFVQLPEPSELYLLQGNHRKDLDSVTSGFHRLTSVRFSSLKFSFLLFSIVSFTDPSFPSYILSRFSAGATPHRGAEKGNELSAQIRAFCLF